MKTIALHGDLGTPIMLQRDLGDLASSVDCFWNGKGWILIRQEFERLLDYCRLLSEPPVLIGYSRGGSLIAKLSQHIDIRAAVLYESPVDDSDGVGGSFPVLMIWNDEGAKTSIWAKRRRDAAKSESIWKASHPVTMLEGRGAHMRVKPEPAHCWDTSLNDQIREWLNETTKETSV